MLFPLRFKIVYPAVCHNSSLCEALSLYLIVQFSLP